MELKAAFCLFCVVAGDALLLEDGRDVFGEADRCRIGGVQGDERRKEEEAECESIKPTDGDEMQGRAGVSPAQAAEWSLAF